MSVLSFIHRLKYFFDNELNKKDYRNIDFSDCEGAQGLLGGQSAESVFSPLAQRKEQI